jgi:hypothetical protein
MFIRKTSASVRNLPDVIALSFAQLLATDVRGCLQSFAIDHVLSTAASLRMIDVTNAPPAAINRCAHWLD